MNRSVHFGLWASYLARRLGVVGWMGLAGLAGAACLWLLWVQPAQERLLSLQQRVRVQTALVQKSATGAPREKTATEQLYDFYAHFQPRSNVPAALERLQALARENKLELESGDYTYARQDGQRLDQLRISLPVRGTYVQLRQFVEQVLQAQPDIALLSLSLRREKLAQDVVDGRLVFLLYVDHQGGAP